MLCDPALKRLSERTLPGQGHWGLDCALGGRAMSALKLPGGIMARGQPRQVRVMKGAHLGFRGHRVCSSLSNV